MLRQPEDDELNDFGKAAWLRSHFGEDPQEVLSDEDYEAPDDGSLTATRGECPVCGERVGELVEAGSWDGRDADGRMTGGAFYSAYCAGCGAGLQAAGSYDAISRGRMDRG